MQFIHILNCVTSQIQMTEILFAPSSTKALGVLHAGRPSAPRHMVKMHICHKHLSSGDELMHRPGFLESFSPLAKVKQVNDFFLCELS